jgi:hypothetical protein
MRSQMHRDGQEVIYGFAVVQYSNAATVIAKTKM